MKQEFSDLQGSPKMPLLKLLPKRCSATLKPLPFSMQMMILLVLYIHLTVIHVLFGENSTLEVTLKDSTMNFMELFI